MAISAFILVADVDAINTDLEALGHGPLNFTVPLRDGAQELATHAALHLGGRDDAFLADLQSLQGTYPSLAISADAGTDFNFTAHVTAASLEWSDPALWTENPVMAGDQRAFGGVIYTSLIDYNVWTPSNYPRGWQGPAAPAGQWAVGATYAVGAVVTYQSQDYVCLQAHTADPGWLPPDVPALWRLVVPEPPNVPALWSPV